MMYFYEFTIEDRSQYVWSDLVIGQTQPQMAIDESAIYTGIRLLLGLRVSTVNQPSA